MFDRNKRRVQKRIEALNAYIAEKRANCFNSLIEASEWLARNEEGLSESEVEMLKQVKAWASQKNDEIAG